MNQIRESIPSSPAMHAAQAAMAAATARPPRVAIVSAAWHRDIVQQAVGAMQATFEQHGVPAEQLQLHEVPGVFEIPLHVQRLARSGAVDAIVACGFVVNGGIYRHEFVSAAVIDALMRVQLETDVPVMSAVLTPRDFHEHDAHLQFFREHFVTKGHEAATACLQTLAALQGLPTERVAAFGG